MITMTELEKELRRPIVIDTSLEVNEAYYVEIETRTEEKAKAELDEEVRTERLELGLSIYHGVREEALRAGIEERFFLKALGEETIGGLEKEIKELDQKYRTHKAKGHIFEEGEISFIVQSLGIYTGLLSGIAVGIYTVFSDISFLPILPMLYGIAGGCMGRVTSMLPGFIIEEILSSNYDKEWHKIRTIDRPKTRTLQKAKSTLEHELHCRGNEGLVSEYIGLGKEIDYDSLLARAMEMQTSEYETLQARYEKAERKIEVKRHLKKSMDDYLGRGYSEEELQASYRGKYGIEMCDESLPLELFTERVEDTASSIIEKRRKEELRKLTEEVVYAA
jgi:hypothetical protein